MAPATPWVAMRSRSQRRSRQASGSIKLHCEELESRNLLSAATLVAQPQLQASPLRGGGGYLTYTPSQILHAYNFTGTTLTGAGQTIAIVDAYDDPNIVSDLQTFDANYGVSPFGSYSVEGVPVPGAGPTFSKVAVAPGATAPAGAYSGTLPTADSGWGVEISLDVEWAHAIAPGANILLVEAASSANSDLLAAVQYAARQPGVSVVSMSWGEQEFATEGSYDGDFVAPGVTFVAASGDNGSWYGASWPAISPNVLAVGGTQLTLSASGGYGSETAWSGSTGGISAYEGKPSYQNTGSVRDPNARANPDVAYNASSNTTFAVYDSYGYSGGLSVYGTSAGAPQWSAILALANQGRSALGEGSLANAQAAVYALPSTDFHDITSGNSGLYAAKSGYDLVTGLGSPNAAAVVGGLIGSNPSSFTVSNLHAASASKSASPGNGQLRHSQGFGALAGNGAIFMILTPSATETTIVQPVTTVNQGNPSVNPTIVSVAGRDGKLGFEQGSPHLQSFGAMDIVPGVGGNDDVPMPPENDGPGDDD